MKLDIVVVDNKSSDNTVLIAQSRNVRTLVNETTQRMAIASLRNWGAEASKGDVVAFLDADMRVPEHWLTVIKQCFENGFKGIMGFVETTPEQAGWVGEAWGARIRLRRNRLMDVDFLPGRNLVVNREVFIKVGGFDPSLTTGEDKDLTMRIKAAGFRAVSNPEVTVIHLGYERSLGEFLHKEYWRQGHTLEFAVRRMYSFRSIRNPVLAFWHLLAGTATLFMFVQLGWMTLLPVALWVAPAVALTWRNTPPSRAGRLFPRIALLEFLRWNVAGIALVSQCRRRIARKLY